MHNRYDLVFNSSTSQSISEEYGTYRTEICLNSLSNLRLYYSHSAIKYLLSYEERLLDFLCELKARKISN